MTKEAPTLADQVIRESYRPHTLMQGSTSRPLGKIRAAIAEAHKFVLDDDMSAFVADLAHGPFLKNRAKSGETLTVMRHGALLPHAKVWIEMSGREVKRRTAQIHSESGKEITDPWGSKYDPDDTAAWWGYLVEQSDRDPSLIYLTEFVSGGPDDPEPPVLVPTQVCWSTSDVPIFDREEYRKQSISRGKSKRIVRDAEGVVEVLSVMAHGIQGLYDPCIVSVPDVAAPDYDRMKKVEYVSEKLGDRLEVPAVVVECSGVARYLIALLSTINDIPVTHETVQSHKGYVARGSYKKFVEHTVVKLNVPQRVSRARLAAKITATIRRRAHEVRGHWRLYQRGDGALCLPSLHQWGAVEADAEKKLHASCSQCAAHRTWIEKHQRGDASLGFVTHSYSVQHQVKA